MSSPVDEQTDGHAEGELSWPILAGGRAVSAGLRRLFACDLCVCVCVHACPWERGWAPVSARVGPDPSLSVHELEGMMAVVGVGQRVGPVWKVTCSCLRVCCGVCACLVVG